MSCKPTWCILFYVITCNYCAWNTEIRGGHLQDVQTVTLWLGVLDSWSVKGSGGLREVVVHGGSTVALSLSSTKEISFEWLTKTIISSIDWTVRVQNNLTMSEGLVPSVFSLRIVIILKLLFMRQFLMTFVKFVNKN